MTATRELFESGNQLYREHRYEEANQVFRRLVAIVPPADGRAAGRAHYGAGQSLFALGSYDEAEQEFRAALVADPALDRARRRLADLAAAHPAPAPPEPPGPAGRPRPPRPPRRGGPLVGTVRQLRRSSEGHAWIARTQDTILRFRLEPQGQPGRAVAVEMRGVRIAGSIEEGDQVEVPAGGRVSSLVNLTTGETVRVHSGSRHLQWAILGLFLVGFAMFFVWVLSNMDDSPAGPGGADSPPPAGEEATTPAPTADPSPDGTATTDPGPIDADVTTDSTPDGETPVGE